MAPCWRPPSAWLQRTPWPRATAGLLGGVLGAAAWLGGMPAPAQAQGLPPAPTVASALPAPQPSAAPAGVAAVGRLFVRPLGHLLIVGGGETPLSVQKRFVALAGGTPAHWRGH